MERIATIGGDSLQSSNTANRWTLPLEESLQFGRYGTLLWAALSFIYKDSSTTTGSVVAPDLLASGLATGCRLNRLYKLEYYRNSMIWIIS